MAVAVGGCEDYDEQPLEFINSSAYTISVTSLSTEWTGFALAPGQKRKMTGIRDVDYAWDGQPIVRGFSTTILRGDRIGIIGPNGCGKSTLLNLLLGRLQPDSGSIEQGTRIEVAYFDQLRDQLDLDKTVIDNVAGGSDKVDINGKSKHVIS